MLGSFRSSPPKAESWRQKARHHLLSYSTVHSLLLSEGYKLELGKGHMVLSNYHSNYTIRRTIGIGQSDGLVARSRSVAARCTWCLGRRKQCTTSRLK